MPRLLTLSRAARLVGVPRGVLQKRIQAGELTSFEGKVDMDELTQAYPQAQFEDNADLERLERIVETALRRARYGKLKKLAMPDAATLASRAKALGKELTQLKTRLSGCTGLIEEIKSRFDTLDTGSPEALAGQVDALKDWFLSALAQQPPPGAILTPLAAKEAFLRLMAAHIKITATGHEFLVDGNDSILQAGLQAGLALDYGCNNGSCGRCKVRVVSGLVKKIRDHEYLLSEQEAQQGVILSCCNTAITDVELDAGEAQDQNDIPRQLSTAWVRKLESPAENVRVLQLRLPRSKRLRFLAGQSAILTAGNRFSGAYPIASCPCEEVNLQFHIQRTPGDACADYIFTTLQTSEVISLSGPQGDFILTGDQTPRHLVFVAYETGFAPIKSLIEQAIALDCAESIHLYWFAADPAHHYMDNLCRAWADALDTFRYTPLESAANVAEPLFVRVFDDYPQRDELEIYVAGPAAFEQSAERFFVAQGVPTAQFHASKTG